MDEQNGDKTLICIDCNDEFTFTKRDQDFYKVHGYVEPKRCYPCRKKKKSRFENKTTQVYVGDKTYPKVDNTKI